MRGLSLFGRVYLFAVGLLLLAAAGMVLLVTERVLPVIEATTTSGLRWIGRDLLADCDEPDRLTRRLVELQRTTPYRLTIVCSEIARFGPHVSLPDTARAALASAGEARIENPDALVVGAPTRFAVIRLGAAVFIGVLWIVVPLVVLVLVAWPAARSLAQPVRRLEADVSRFGAGDLSVRTTVRRGDEVGSLASAFNVMAERLEAQSRAQQLLMAGISHELRTPLQRMTSALALMDEKNESRSSEILRAVSADIRQLSTLLDDVFLLARFEQTPTFERLLRVTRGTAAELIDDALSEATFTLPAGSLIVDMPDAVAETPLDFDTRLAPRALKNLVDNARKHAGDAPIRVTAQVQAGQLRIEVADRGPGLTAVECAEAFVPFAQLGPDRTGVGLGLALARAIARAHGGTLAADTPDPGTSGARLVLTLPTARLPVEAGS